MLVLLPGARLPQSQIFQHSETFSCHHRRKGCWPQSLFEIPVDNAGPIEWVRLITVIATFTSQMLVRYEL